MLFRTITTAVTLAGLVSAAPFSSYPPPCATICQNGMDDCGQPWGGCWDICKPDESPTPPPCTVTYTPTIPPITPYPPITLPVITPDPTITLPIITGDGDTTSIIPTPRSVD
ncbi:hypothetical protein NW752_004516 [Fusarium irregulare]|uniref:Uncharacterized protein n=1 Tax=Fusarium irregulare TaxID=2494466 RepID=A0A9W8PP31_9HYPO|nr:hypothetical protein NW766_007423 [Fusarium irregulare]KAJ4021508.1 hypothetical protein NW752_004516 [Fusarium irregulare]